MKKPMLILLILLLATSVTLGLLSRQEPASVPAMAGGSSMPTAAPTEATTAAPTEAPTAEPLQAPDATLTDMPAPDTTPEAVG